MKFGTQDKSKMLISNILIRIQDLDPKMKICKIWPRNWNMYQFLWNLTLRANRSSILWIQYLELIILTQNYKFVWIWSENWNVFNVYEFWHSELIEYDNFYKLYGILDLGRFGSALKYNIILLGIHCRENGLILNILFGIDDLVPNFGPAMEVLSLALRTNRIFELIFVAWTLGKFHFKIEIWSLVIHKASIRNSS